MRIEENDDREKRRIRFGLDPFCDPFPFLIDALCRYTCVRKRRRGECLSRYLHFWDGNIYGSMESALSRATWTKASDSRERRKRRRRKETRARRAVGLRSVCAHARLHILHICMRVRALCFFAASIWIEKDCGYKDNRLRSRRRRRRRRRSRQILSLGYFFSLLIFLSSQLLSFSLLSRFLSLPILPRLDDDVDEDPDRDAPRAIFVTLCFSYQHSLYIVHPRKSIPSPSPS